MKTLQDPNYVPASSDHPLKNVEEYLYGKLRTMLSSIQKDHSYIRIDDQVADGMLFENPEKQ